MRPVKTQPRFRCDFCRKVSTRAAMEKHERICWNNPDRYCDLCDNKGYHDDGYPSGEPCHYCSQRKVRDEHGFLIDPALVSASTP